MQVLSIILKKPALDFIRLKSGTTNLLDSVRAWRWARALEITKQKPSVIVFLKYLKVF